MLPFSIIGMLMFGLTTSVRSSCALLGTLILRRQLRRLEPRRCAMALGLQRLLLRRGRTPLPYTHSFVITIACSRSAPVRILPERRGVTFCGRLARTTRCCDCYPQRNSLSHSVAPWRQRAGGRSAQASAQRIYYRVTGQPVQFCSRTAPRAVSRLANIPSTRHAADSGG
jgi:hypothetical protein